jgi:8-oxo-dGTP pyrophosphatase MutT (NUDIX family)
MKSFERRSTREIYANPFLSVEVHDIMTPGGTEGEHVLIVTPPASAAIIGDGGDLLFCRQPRFGAQADVVEIVKGGAEPGESPLQCAQREAREELGIVAAEWEPLGQLLEVPSIMNSPVELFYAHGIEHVDPSTEATESVELVRIPETVAFRAAASGQINDAVTLAALLRYGSRKGLLRL